MKHLRELTINIKFNIIERGVVKVATNEDLIISTFNYLKSNSIKYSSIQPLAQRRLNFFVKKTSY